MPCTCDEGHLCDECEEALGPLMESMYALYLAENRYGLNRPRREIEDDIIAAGRGHLIRRD